MSSPWWCQHFFVETPVSRTFESWSSGLWGLAFCDYEQWWVFRAAFFSSSSIIIRNNFEQWTRLLLGARLLSSSTSNFASKTITKGPNMTRKKKQKNESPFQNDHIMLIIIKIKIKIDPSENDKQFAVKLTVRGRSGTIHVPQERDKPVHHVIPDDWFVPLDNPNVTICMRVHAAHHRGTGDLFIKQK